MQSTKLTYLHATRTCIEHDRKEQKQGSAVNACTRVIEVVEDTSDNDADDCIPNNTGGDRFGVVSESLKGPA